MLDHFSRAAIEEHLKDVAEPLMKAFGDKPPYAVFSDSLEVYGSDWTADFAAEFQKRRGYDIVPYLPQLLHGGSAEAASVRHDWGRTLAELVRENYLTPVTRFAEAHQTRFRSQTYGEPAVTLADEATPALPEGEGPQWRDFSFTRWATSASHIYGRTVTSAETWTWLHSPAFRATPLDMKAEADRMFLLGVNQIVGHGYPYSPESAGEPGWSLYAAAAFNAHNPWFPVMPEVTLYLQRLSWLLRQGSPANDVAVLLPEDDAQAAFTPGHVSVTVEMKQRISSALMGKILDTGYNIDYIDVASILKTGGVHYPVLVLPSVERIPLSAYRAIAAYAAAGGKVIALGTTPSLAPGLREAKESSEIVALSEKLFRAEGHPGVLAASEAALPDVLRKSLVPDLLVQGNAEGLGFLHRHLDESDIYFLANTSNHPIEAMVHPRAMRKSYAMWSPDNGAVLAKGADDVNSRIALELAPYESRVLVLSEEDGKAVAEKVVPEPDKTKELSDLSQGWQLCFTKGGSAQSVDLPKSWTEIKDRNFYSGEGVYTRTFTLKADQGSGRRVWLDFGEGTPTVDPRPASAPGIHALIEGPVREAAIVEINGVRAGALWHAPWRVEVSGLLHAGENQIVVHVYNTAINHLAAGPKRDFGDLNAKFGKRFEMQDMDNLQALPSGLLGPVKLVEERE